MMELMFLCFVCVCLPGKGVNLSREDKKMREITLFECLLTQEEPVLIG